jgi:ATP-dependent Clp protease, protease subunit
MIRLEDETPPATEAPGAMLEKAIFKSRTILLTGGIDDKQAHRVCQALLAFSSDNDDPITMILSSPGGHVESGDMIHDMIGWVKPKVKILGTGWVASAGALIYCSVPREDRYCTPNTRFLLHEPRGGVGGPASDVEIQVRELVTMRARLNRIFAAATGQKFEKIVEDTDRDYWMQADEAKAYGLVGSIVKSASEM